MKSCYLRLKSLADIFGFGEGQLFSTDEKGLQVTSTDIARNRGMTCYREILVKTEG
jgi:hypothetical protein